MAEFELAKPRIHPAEFYGGNEDDSADGPVCVFRGNAITDSDVRRSRIPDQRDR